MAKKTKREAVKKVKIRLPITRTEKDDVTVFLNGLSYLIKRGVQVEVPEGVAEILDRKEKMLEIAMAYDEAMSDKNDNAK